MSDLAPRDPAYADRVRVSFGRQAFMTLLGAEVVSVAPGTVEIALAVRPELGQQHGHVHAGACSSIADSAAGYAAQSLMAAEDGVLTVELKANLLAPAEGTRLIARGRVERAGRRLTVARSAVFAEKDGAERQVLTALGTFMTMPGLGDRD